MNPENVKQIVESIKTLNINFNDATTQKIAEQVLPVIKYWVMYKLAVEVMGFVLYLVVWLAVIYVIYRIAKMIYNVEVKELDK